MQFISSYPWYYSLICILGGALFSGALYIRDKKNEERSKSLLAGLVTLRFLSVSIIALLLLDIFIKHLVNETEKPLIIIAQDNSSSITANKDSSEIKTKYLNSLNTFISAVKEKYDVKTYQFDSDSKPSETFDFKGKETDVSKLFSNIENNYANKNIGAIILATDGIYNKGNNPLYSSNKINTPIYTIALGDTTPLKDAWIQTINHNQVAYLGNSFPVEVIVNASDLIGKKLSISISKSGKTIQSEQLTINATSFSKPISFLINAEKTGIQNYNVSLSVLNEDKNKQNNSQSFAIDIIDNREKILILSNAPHPDIAAIKQSILSTQTYEVEFGLIQEFSKPIKPYSLIIVHQVKVLPKKISDEISLNNKPIFYISSQNTTSGSTKFNDVEGVYKKEFSLFNISNELQNYINKLPAVKSPFNIKNTLTGNNILIAQKIGVVETEQALLSFSEINGIKNGFFTGDGLWKWKMRDFLDHENHNLFNELINKSIQYLSVKADKSFFRVTSKKIVNENESIDLTAELYNQSYELITEPDVTLTLKNEGGKIYNYTFNKKQTLYSLSIGLFPAGQYTYEAKVKYGDKFYVKSGVIVVKEIISEKINTVANHQLLYQLSNQSGGKLFYENQLEELKKEILSRESIKSITYSHKQLNDLINFKWIFLVILILLSTEWFLRKNNGKI